MVETESLEVKLNYYAMAVAILAECSVETAFEKLQHAHPDKVKAQISEEDNQDILQFRTEGLPWTEIASYYGVYWTTIYGRVLSRKGKVG